MTRDEIALKAMEALIIADHVKREYIPENKLVVLQSNNMIHDDHVYNHSTIEQFSKDFNLDQT